MRVFFLGGGVGLHHIHTHRAHTPTTHHTTPHHTRQRKVRTTVLKRHCRQRVSCGFAALLLCCFAFAFVLFLCSVATNVL